MGKLIILSRPGLQVVTGKVVSCYPGANKFTIENDITLGGVKTTKRLELRYSKTAKLKLAEGAYVIASIKPTEMLYALNDGVALNRETFFAEAFVVRYTGAFDFEPIGKEKEAHVFAGSIQDKRKLDNGGNLLTVAWKHNGEEEKRLLYAPVDIRSKLSNKAVFVTGAPKITKIGLLYGIQGLSNL